MQQPSASFFRTTSVAIISLALHLVLVLTHNAQSPLHAIDSQSQVNEFALRLIAAPISEREKLIQTNAPFLTPELASAILAEGDKKRATGPMTEVLDVYRLGLSVAEKIADKYWMARFHNSIGNTLKQMDDRERALAEYEKGFRLAEEHGDKALMARLAYNLSDFPGYGDAYLDKAFLLANESGNKEMMAVTAGKVGNRHTIRGELVEAKKLLQSALQLRRELGAPGGISIALSNLSVLQMKLGEYDEARENLQQAIALERSVIDLYNLGNLYLLIGDYSSALSSYHASREAAKKIDPKDEVAPILINIANLYLEQGNLQQAESMYLQTLSAFERSKANYGIARALAGLRDVYTDKRDLKTATTFAERAHQVYLSEKDDEVTRSFWKLGLLYAAAGDERKAEEYLREAVASAEQKGSEIFASRLAFAEFEFGRRNWEQAFVRANDAIASLGQKEEVTPKAWRAYHLLGRIALVQGKSESAGINFERAISLIERNRTFIAGSEDEDSRFLANKLAPYRALVAVAAEAGDTNAVFRLAERLKARALVDTVTGRRPILSGLTDAERDTHRDLVNQIVSLNARLAKESSSDPNSQTLALRKELEGTRLQYEDFLNQMITSHPGFAIQRGKIQQVELPELPGIIPRDTVAISFILDQESLYAIAVDASGLRVVRIKITQPDLTQKIDRFRTMLGSGNLRFQDQSRELYHLLLQPLAAGLAGKKNVIIVPDGSLWDLPFNALTDGNGKYLIETHSISYAPSLTALREMAKTRRARATRSRNELLAFGNPIIGGETKSRVEQVFMNESLEALPDAERLVRSLGDLYGQNRSKVFTGSAAKEQVVKSEAANYRIVQFATHGVLNNASPMYSHLVLAQNDQNPNEDGLLEAWELKDLRLSADMVILSACDTARGQISGGEGMIGMTWAAFIAGAPTTVASQWKVESSSTTELMLEFHRQMLGDNKISKAEALRRAQLKLLRTAKYRHPSYWAPWVLVGDGS